MNSFHEIKFNERQERARRSDPATEKTKGQQIRQWDPLYPWGVIVSGCSWPRKTNQHNLAAEVQDCHAMSCLIVWEAWHVTHASMASDQKNLLCQSSKHGKTWLGVTGGWRQRAWVLVPQIAKHSRGATSCAMADLHGQVVAFCDHPTHAGLWKHTNVELPWLTLILLTSPQQQIQSLVGCALFFVVHAWSVQCKQSTDDPTGYPRHRRQEPQVIASRKICKKDRSPIWFKGPKLLITVKHVKIPTVCLYTDLTYPIQWHDGIEMHQVNSNTVANRDQPTHVIKYPIFFCRQRTCARSMRQLSLKRRWPCLELNWHSNSWMSSCS